MKLAFSKKGIVGKGNPRDIKQVDLNVCREGQKFSAMWANW